MKLDYITTVDNKALFLNHEDREVVLLTDSMDWYNLDTERYLPSSGDRYKQCLRRQMLHNPWLRCMFGRLNDGSPVQLCFDFYKYEAREFDEEYISEATKRLKKSKIKSRNVREEKPKNRRRPALVGDPDVV